MADTWRVIVTGPRLWPDLALLARHLLAAGREALDAGKQPVLVHGQCDPRHPDTGRPIPWALAKKMSWEVQRRYWGADWLAEQAAFDMLGQVSWEIERHPADWEAPCRDTCRRDCRRRRWDGTDYCSMAGNYRNGKMTGLGADCCLYCWMPCADPRHRAWRPHGTHGAGDCAKRAERAGIPVTRIPVD